MSQCISFDVNFSSEAIVVWNNGMYTALVSTISLSLSGALIVTVVFPNSLIGITVLLI